MASSSSSTSQTNPLFGSHVSEKLNKQNYQLWSAQVLTTIRGARLEGHITGKTEVPPKEIDKTPSDDKKTGDKIVRMANPAYDEWFAADQQVLGFIFSSLSRDVLSQVATVQTAVEGWAAIQGMFTTKTRARSMNVRLSLYTTKKGSSTISEYLGKMKAYGDELAASGKPPDDEELIAFILNGLDDEYDPIVSALVARVEPLTLSDAYAQLLSFENRLEMRRAEIAANAAGRGNRGGFSSRGGRGNRGSGHGAPSAGANRGGRTGGGGRNDTRPVCQVCFKRGHAASDCWHRFDQNYVPEERHVAAAVSYAYGADSNWYIDSGATDHITSELDKLSIRDKYKGNDHVHTTNGAGMEIKHIGQSFVSTPMRNLHLKNVLHVPQATKNLVSASKLASDNSAFVEIHGKYFLVKDRAMRTTMLEGRCRQGLYPLPTSSSSTSPTKQAHAVVPSFARWHGRLGHPANPIVSRVISKNKLPCQGMESRESVCDACQMAKSHQLPYHKSNSVSNFPLELIFSDV